MKKVGCFILRFVFTSVLSWADFQAGFRLFDFQDIVSRALFRNEEIRAFALMQNETLSGGGFESGFITVGSVVAGGLLRLAENPMGYGAGSPVFSETTSLKLLPAFEASPRLAVVLKPLREQFCAFLLAEDSEILQGMLESGMLSTGAFAGFRLLPGMTHEILFAVSKIMPRKKIDPSNETWYADGLASVRGWTLVAAHRLQLRGNAWKTVFDSMCSAGEALPPGWFGELAAEASGAFRFLFLLRGKTEDFTGLDGERDPEAFGLHASAETMPFPFVSVHFRYGKSMPHRVDLDHFFYAGVESVSAGMRFFLPQGSGTLPLFEAEYSAEKTDFPVFLKRDRETYGIAVHPVALDWMSLAFFSEINLIHGQWDGETELRMELAVFWFRLRLSYTLAYDEKAIAHSGAARISMTSERFSWFVKAEAGSFITSEDIIVSLGLEITL